MKRGLKVILILIAIFLLADAAAYLFQDRLIFQSKKLRDDHEFRFDQPYEEFNITTTDNEKINLLWFKPAQASKGIVLYFHGNASNLQRWGKYAIDITSLGYEVVMMDYRGYGKSSGKPSEDLLHQDALELYKWVTEKANRPVEIIYGRSLGSAVATRLAAEVQPKLLILETPFDEVRNARFAKVFFFLAPPRNQFRTKDYLPKVTGKKVIFHGTNDWVVPLSAAEGLKPYLSNADEFIIIQGGGHRNLRDFDRYHAVLKTVLK